MKIYIDRCHGCGQDRGASKFLNEEICSDKMIDLVVPKLQSLGHNVLAQRPSGNLTVQQSLNWRCQQANAWGADVFISNHNNAGGGEGAEVYTYNGEQLNEAKRYLQYILDHGGKTHDGTLTHKSIPGAIINGNDLAVIKGTSMKVMLLENFYVDTQSDCDFFSKNLEMFANALVYGITGVNLENTIVEERKQVDYIVVYSNDVDKRSAEYLADYLQCPTISSDRNFDYTRVETVYAVGGSKGTYTSYLRDENFITGSDRYETIKAVLKRIGKS